MFILKKFSLSGFISREHLRTIYGKSGWARRNSFIETVSVKSNGHIGNTIQLNKVSNSNFKHMLKNFFFIQAFKEKKCHLQCENLSRWSSSFLMLKSVKRAYEKGAFNDNGNICAYENWNTSSNISTSISSVA